MRKRGVAILAAAAVAILGVTGWVIARNDMSDKIFEFEIGKTLQETAAQTRLPLSGDNDWGLISASPPQFPDGVYGKYAKKGFEINIGPLSWIIFYSDTKSYPNKLVNIASLSIDTTQSGFTTHAQIYDYVYALIEQLQRGKWQRYIPEECPRLTGKASIIDPKEIESLAVPELKNWVSFDCPIDPEYKPGLEEWKKFISDVRTYLWHDGSGIVARLDVSVDEPELRPFDPKRDVRLHLEFELEESIKDRAAGNREAELKEPWGARVPKVEAEKRRIRDLLEQRAGKPAASRPPADMPLRVKAREACPRTGYWRSYDNRNERRFLKQGEPMPDLRSSYGFTLWQWDPNQSSS